MRIINLPLYKVRNNYYVIFRVIMHNINILFSFFSSIVELHPYLQQSRLVEWAKQQGIQVTAYSSFGPSFYTVMSDDARNAAP
jgi:predicted sugar kinase